VRARYHNAILTEYIGPFVVQIKITDRIKIETHLLEPVHKIQVRRKLPRGRHDPRTRARPKVKVWASDGSKADAATIDVAVVSALQAVGLRVAQFFPSERKIVQRVQRRRLHRIDPFVGVSQVTQRRK